MYLGIWFLQEASNCSQFQCELCEVGASYRSLCGRCVGSSAGRRSRSGSRSSPCGPTRPEGLRHTSYRREGRKGKHEEVVTTLMKVEMKWVWVLLFTWCARRTRSSSRWRTEGRRRSCPGCTCHRFCSSCGSAQILREQMDHKPLDQSLPTCRGRQRSRRGGTFDVKKRGQINKL